MRLLFPVLFLILTAPGLRAQHSYFFKTYTHESGLADNNVRCVVRDDQGFLWIGTESGLSRFDGTRFVNFRSWQSDSSTLSSNSIYDLFIDSRKRLWVSALGMNIYQPETGKFRRIRAINHTGDYDYSVEVFSVFEDQKNRLLICTPYIGLQLFDEKEGVFKRFINKAKNSSGTEAVLPYSVTSVIQDQEGIFWMLNYTHLYRYDESSGILDEFPCLLSGSSGTGFQSLRVHESKSDKNRLLITTWGDGLVRFDKTEKTFKSELFETEKPKNLRNIVMSVYQPGTGFIWAGTNSGIRIFDEKQSVFSGSVTDLFSAESLVDSTMTNCIYKDSEGIIWIGTSIGLSSVHPGKQLFVSNRIAQFNRSFFKMSGTNGLIYATEYYNERSLVVIHPETGETRKFKLPDADENKAEPFYLTSTEDESVWIGTTKGVYRFHTRTQHISKADITTADGRRIEDPRTTGLITDRKGSLWISCRGFILRKTLSENHFVRIDSVFNGRNYIMLNDIELMAVNASEGVLLYSTENDLIELDDAGRFKKQVKLLNPNGLRVSQVTDMEPAADSSLWFTTHTNGLIHLSGKGELKIYRHDFTGNQLSDLVSLTTDNSHRPWFVSGGRIYTLDPSGDKVIFYSFEDGLPSINRSTNLEKFNDGSIAFNISKGLFSFKPENLKRKPRSLDVTLYGIYVNGKKLESGTAPDRITTISLIHEQNNIVLDFVARNYLSPSSTVYSYLLKGVNDEWSVPSPVGLLNFNQLMPGTYLLQVKAGSPDIPDDAPYQQLKIVIHPAWYQTLLFKLSVVLLFLIILVVAIRFFVTMRYKEQIVAMNHNREIEQIRARIARDIHDEIGAGLTKIKLMTRKLFKSGPSDDQPELRTKITETADELIRNLGEIVWTINPENDSLENIVAFIRIYLSRLADENPELKIELDLPAPEAVPHLIVNPQIKRNVLLILKEAINNSIKHSHSTQMKVALRTSEQSLHLLVSDNGTGFGDEALQSAGNGLKNMKKRAAGIGGELKINSENTGTSIELKAPLHVPDNLL